MTFVGISNKIAIFPLDDCVRRLFWAIEYQVQTAKSSSIPSVLGQSASRQLWWGLPGAPENPSDSFLSLSINKLLYRLALCSRGSQRTWYARDILAYWLLARPGLSPSLRLKWKEEASQLWHFQFLPSFSSVIFYQGVSFLCVTKLPA